jgi:hypothetical protein
MLRAIALKELRETWWIAVLPAAILILIVLNALGLDVDEVPPFVYWRMNRNPGWVHPVPFEGDTWPLTVLVLGGVAAAVMALWQTLVESAQGTWSFYLHRPAARRSLILAKLGIGLGAMLICIGLPLLFYALWAATPGTHANPFEWWMAGPTLRAWAYLSVAYLAAFLCGVRPVRWWVSRFFPAVLPICVWLPIVVVPWTGWPMWLLIGAADAVLLAAIVCVTETRDWA